MTCRLKSTAKPSNPRSVNAALAQLVEHVIRNDGVIRSSRISGTISLHVPDYFSSIA
jgi:hypothetical protein